MPKAKPTTVDEYIASAPEAAQAKLIEIRAILKSLAPDAKELLKWGNPAFDRDGKSFEDFAVPWSAGAACVHVAGDDVRG